MKTLFLHLGPSKSGSTYIQTSLELSRESLAAAGVSYPALPRGLSHQGQSIYGNYPGLFDHLRSARPGGPHLLISGESLHEHLQNVDYIDLLGRLAQQGGFQRVSCLLLPRDPVDHAAAIYQQRVKHIREARTVETIFELYDSPLQTLRLVRELEALGAELTLRNYGAVRGRLLEIVEGWLGVPTGHLVRPDVDVVNRSLTRAELELQRALNQALGRRAPRLTSRMVEDLPDLASHRALPSVEVQQAMLARLAPAVVDLNQYLPMSEPLSLVPKDPSADSPYVFTAGQIDLLAAGIADELRQRDPFFNWRGRLPWQLAKLGKRAFVKLRSSLGRTTEAPNLHRSAVHLTRTPGWFARTVEAAVILSLIGPVRRLVPMRMWSRVVGQRGLASQTPPDRERPTPTERSVAQAVRSAASWVPFEVTCLDQAVAGSVMLRRRGGASAVVIGMNRLDPTDTSHAWLVGESGAVLVGGDRLDEFTPVTAFSRVART